MRLIIAPHIDVRPGQRVFPGDYLDKDPVVEVPDDSVEKVGAAISRAIEQTADALRDDAELDAPPFSSAAWWGATIVRHEDTVSLYSFEPVLFYAIEDDGRLRLEQSLNDVTIAEFARSLSEDLYPASEPTLVVTRGGEFGGGEVVVTTLLGWLWDFAPGMLVQLGIDRSLGWSSARRQARLEKLAEDWSSHNIEHPRHLRRFVETKRRWFPSVLATRLALSESAARRLLAALGYESGDDDVMELRIGDEAMRARDTWIYGESSPYYEGPYDDEDLLEE